MIESPRFYPNIPNAIRLLRAYREAWIFGLKDRNSYSRECVVYALQSACGNHEVPLEWALKLHDIPSYACHEEYWKGMREHLESLPFIKGVQFENISEFDHLLEKISTMEKNDRLLLVLYPKDGRAHIVHVIHTVPWVLNEGETVLVNDNERDIREINEVEFQRNIAPEPIYNCIFFKEAD